MTDGTVEPGDNDGPVDAPVSQGGQNLRDVLMEIRAKRGALTPPIVVEEAADPMHPLHHPCGGAAPAAARNSRLRQASQLRRVRYKHDAGDERADLRAFWVIRDADGAP